MSLTDSIQTTINVKELKTKREKTLILKLTFQRISSTNKRINQDLSP